MVTSLFNDEPATDDGDMSVKALASWFGSNRMLAAEVGKQLRGLKWVGVPFAGGMSELAHITAPSLSVNDLHRHVINLARVVGHPVRGPELAKRLAGFPFHPDVLEYAQTYCRGIDTKDIKTDDELLKWAEQYFITTWMGRSANAGTDREFSGSLPVRWNGNGGDSNTRFRSAVESLDAWGRIMRRCNFTVMDWSAFLGKCKDEPQHGVYSDAPWPDAGEKYIHKFTTADQRRLAAELAKFKHARVVVRFGDHPLIRELYPEPRWTWLRLAGRKQSNAESAEALILNGPVV